MAGFDPLHPCDLPASLPFEEGRRRGALLVAFGAPEDAAAPPAVRERLAAAGGRSPLGEHLAHQRTALAESLRRRGAEMPVATAMLHGGPALAAAVEQLREAGADDLAVVPLAPQFSHAISGAICDAVSGELVRDAASGAATPGPRVAFVRDWHLEPRFISALASATYEALDALWSNASSWRPNVDWALGSKMDSHVVFLAAALPDDAGGGAPRAGSYPALVEETASAVAGSLGLRSWSHAFYDSTLSLAAERSLPGPTLVERLRDLADRDERDVVACPVGSAADDIDLLYEIDVVGQRVATELGIRLERARSLNDDPAFVAGLGDLILRALGGAR